MCPRYFIQYTRCTVNNLSCLPRLSCTMTDTFQFSYNLHACLIVLDVNCVSILLVHDEYLKMYVYNKYVKVCKVLLYTHTHVHTHAHQHMCQHTCTHMRPHTCTSTPTHTHTRARTHTCTPTHTRAHTHMQAHTHVSPHARPHTHTHMRAHKHAHTRVCTRVPIHTHTHTHSLGSVIVFEIRSENFLGQQKKTNWIQ